MIPQRFQCLKRCTAVLQRRIGELRQESKADARLPPKLHSSEARRHLYSKPCVSTHAHAITIRSLASKVDELLANEKLVAALIRKSGGLSADKLQVRVVLEGGSEEKATPQLVSLTQAIRMSIDLDNRDIIALSLDQDIPVLRIDHLNSFLYRQNKRAGSKSSNKKQIEKEFRFNAQIEENDLKRKVESISESLDKGATCIVSLKCKGWMLKKEPELIRTTAKRVIDNLNGVAELVNEVKVVGDGTRAQFRLRPAK